MNFFKAVMARWGLGSPRQATDKIEVELNVSQHATQADDIFINPSDEQQLALKDDAGATSLKKVN